jgi:hypothetical protein
VLWISAVENDDLSIFPSAMNVAAEMKIKQKVQFKKNVVEHMLSLQEGFLKKILPVCFNKWNRMGYFAVWSFW